MFNKIIFVKLILIVISVRAWGGPTCTKENVSKWQDKTKFQTDLVKKGYKIKVFKVTSGNCYEIYGWDKDSNKVEIYFNPITGKIVKQRNS